MQNTDLNQTTILAGGLVEKSQTIQLPSCSIDYIYGLIVSNIVTTKKFYFNTKGIYNQTFYIKGTQRGWKKDYQQVPYIEFHITQTGILYRVSHYTNRYPI